MFPNLMGQKALHKLSNEEMGKIIGISRTAFESKVKSDRFTAEECRTYCKYFSKQFEFLFARDSEC